MATFQVMRKGLDVSVGLRRTGTVTNANEIPNLAQVQAIAEGLAVTKEAVIVCTDSNIDLATGGLLTIDGITLTAGQRVLVKSQTDPVENGIYDAAVGAWSRSDDADEQSELKPLTSVRVLSGSHSGRTYQLTNTTNPIPDTDAQTWVVVAASSDKAVDVSVVDTLFTQIAGTDVQAVLDSVDNKLQDFHDSRYQSAVTTLTSGTGIVFNHAMNKQYLPSVKVYDSTTGEDLTAAVTIVATDANNVTITNDGADVDVVVAAIK